MKKIAMLLTLVAASLVFVGCASQKPVAADNTAAATQPAPVKSKDLKGESI